MSDLDFVLKIFKNKALLQREDVIKTLSLLLEYSKSKKVIEVAKILLNK